MQSILRDQRTRHLAYTYGDLYDIYSELVEKSHGPMLEGEHLLDPLPWPKESFEKKAEQWSWMDATQIRAKVEEWQSIIGKFDAGSQRSQVERQR